MLPLIDKKKTGVNLRRIMDERGLIERKVGSGHVGRNYFQ